MEKVHINKPLLTIVGKTLAVFASLIFLVWVVQFYVIGVKEEISIPTEHLVATSTEESLPPLDERIVVDEDKIYTVNFCGADLAFQGEILIDGINVVERLGEIASEGENYICKNVIAFDESGLNELLPSSIVKETDPSIKEYNPHLDLYVIYFGYSQLVFELNKARFWSPGYDGDYFVGNLKKSDN